MKTTQLKTILKIIANQYSNTKNRGFFFLLLLLNMYSYSQESYFNYSPIKIIQAKAIEEQYNATQYFPTYKIYNPDKVYELERPWFFERPQNGDSEPVNVQYSFSKKDSIVRRIEYA